MNIPGISTRVTFILNLQHHYLEYTHNLLYVHLLFECLSYMNTPVLSVLTNFHSCINDKFMSYSFSVTF